MKELSPESQQVVRIKRRVLSVTCDRCKRVITPYPEGSIGNTRYFEVMTGHRSWGYESGDSIEHFDICPDCIGSFVAEYVRKSCGTAYLEMETNYVTGHKYKYVDE